MMLFMASLPDLPENHELAPYARYMMATANQLVMMMWLWLIAKVLMVGIVGFFIFKTYRLRMAVSKLVKELTEERKEVKTLLAVIKGWTVVRDTADKKVADKAREVADEVKKSIDTAADAIPTKTKDLLVTALADMHSPSGEGEIPVLKPPSGSYRAPPKPSESGSP